MGEAVSICVGVGSHGQGDAAYGRIVACSSIARHVDEETVGINQVREFLEDVRERDVSKRCNWHGGTGFSREGDFIFFAEEEHPSLCDSGSRGREGGDICFGIPSSRRRAFGGCHGVPRG